MTLILFLLLTSLQQTVCVPTSCFGTWEIQKEQILTRQTPITNYGRLLDQRGAEAQRIRNISQVRHPLSLWEVDCRVIYLIPEWSENL